MAEHIGQRELRDDGDAVLRRVEQGESFVITRNGKPIADLVPHPFGTAEPRKKLGELHEFFRALPKTKRKDWEAERAEAEEFFADDRIDY